MNTYNPQSCRYSSQWRAENSDNIDEKLKKLTPQELETYKKFKDKKSQVEQDVNEAKKKLGELEKKKDQAFSAFEKQHVSNNMIKVKEYIKSGEYILKILDKAT